MKRCDCDNAQKLGLEERVVLVLYVYCFRTHRVRLRATTLQGEYKIYNLPDWLGVTLLESLYQETEKYHHQPKSHPCPVNRSQTLLRFAEEDYGDEEEDQMPWMGLQRVLGEVEGMLIMTKSFRAQTTMQPRLG